MENARKDEAKAKKRKSLEKASDKTKEGETNTVVPTFGGTLVVSLLR